MSVGVGGSRAPAGPSPGEGLGSGLPAPAVPGPPSVCVADALSGVRACALCSWKASGRPRPGGRNAPAKGHQGRAVSA